MQEKVDANAVLTSNRLKGTTMTILSTLRSEANGFLRRFGLHLVRLNGLPSERRAMLLRHHRIRTVVDVGANNGAYGVALRGAGYSGKIISFEPTADAYRALAARAEADPFWTAIKSAIGEVEGEVMINVAANQAASSSLLPMLNVHSQSAPESRFVSSEKVDLATLDQALDGLLRPDERLFLKIDTQGYEEMVLKGAPEVLKQVELIECELSFIPLYEGQLCFTEMLSMLKDLGYSPIQFVPGFTNPLTGHCFQVDGIFCKSQNV